jgi:hypothetical protein
MAARIAQNKKHTKQRKSQNCRLCQPVAREQKDDALTLIFKGSTLPCSYSILILSEMLSNIFKEDD